MLGFHITVIKSLFSSAVTGGQRSLWYTGSSGVVCPSVRPSVRPSVCPSTISDVSLIFSEITGRIKLKLGEYIPGEVPLDEFLYFPDPIQDGRTAAILDSKVTIFDYLTCQPTFLRVRCEDKAENRWKHTRVGAIERVRLFFPLRSKMAERRPFWSLKSCFSTHFTADSGAIYQDSLKLPYDFNM